MLGIARLAGLGKAAKAGLELYNKNKTFQFATQAGADFGLSAMFGIPLDIAASSAVGTGLGSLGGRMLGNKIAGETGELAGDFVGAVGGGTIGGFAPDIFRSVTGLDYDAGEQPKEPPAHPDTAQSDPRSYAMQQQMQTLSPLEIQKMQEQAQRRAAQANYQAAAMQQYGGYQ